jgi:hypothetical protein
MSLPVGCSTKRRCFLLTLPWRGRVGSHRAKQDARGVKSWNEISPHPSFHSRRPRERASLVSTPPGEGESKAESERGHAAGAPVKDQCAGDRGLRLIAPTQARSTHRSLPLGPDPEAVPIVSARVGSHPRRPGQGEPTITWERDQGDGGNDDDGYPILKPKYAR